MKTELVNLALALGLSLAAAPAMAQDAPPRLSYGGYEASAPAPAPAADEAQELAPEGRGEGRPARARADVGAYLEVAQVLSADLSDGGETLTYTSVAAGVDGSIQTRRVTAQLSYRYERDIDWSDDGVDTDQHAGIAQVSIQLAPGALQLDAGALATRTGGDGRVFGVTNRDPNVDVYAAYVGPSLSTHAGPLAVNASYRLGYVKVDDNRALGNLNDDFDESVSHSATASIGMAPGGTGLPFGWTVGAGYAREDSGGRFDQRFEGAYVRGDVVVPLGPTLALTAGVGYEDIESTQRDLVRDGTGAPVIGPNGPTPDPNAPRLLTYDTSGLIYDGGVIWRPGPRTELQARAGHRYGGTTYAGSFDHRFRSDAGIHIEAFDTVETFGRLLVNDFSGLPTDFDVNRDPVTGGLGGCVFGRQGGGGSCLDRSLSAVTGATFRLRGVSAVLSGTRGLWSYGIGAGYARRRYSRPTQAQLPGFASVDETASVYASVGRQLSRTSQVDLTAFASWYDSDLNLDTINTLGTTLSYNRSFLTERLQFQAAFGLYYSDDGTDSATNASALGGLRYTF